MCLMALHLMCELQGQLHMWGESLGTTMDVANGRYNSFLLFNRHVNPEPYPNLPLYNDVVVLVL